MKSINIICIMSLSLSIQTAMSQFKATTECYPTVSKSINGVKEFNREKFINLGSNSEAGERLNSDDRKYLFEDLEIKVGRGLGMVSGESKWNKTLREDPNRAGYADIDYLRTNIKSNDEGNLEYYKRLFGDNEGMAFHDSHNAYPEFMAKYNLVPTSKEDQFPENNDAAGEIVANILKYKFSDFTRPQFYEPVNEPKWQYWKDQRFIEHHTEIKRHVDAMGLNVKVGGPCLSVSNFYGNGFKNTKQVTDFIDATENKLDFYSFHTYDYITWDSDKREWAGEINAGAPLEGVFDAISSYTYNKYGTEWSYVASEHGGYLPAKSYGPGVNDQRSESLKDIAATYLKPDSGFDYDMELRSIENFLMVSSAISNTFVFMNQPHIVLKAVPFILLDTSKWNTHYYASLCVKENFDKRSPNFYITKLSYFYEFFKGVEGDIVHSWCDSGDLQHIAYRNDKELILLYHNVSVESGEVKLNFNEYKGKIKGATIRRVGYYEDSRKPYLTEEAMKSSDSFKISPRESVAIFIPLNGGESRQLEERANYANEQSVQFKGSHTFSLDIKDAAEVEESFLRVGINRPNGVTDGITIKLNGEQLATETETSANRYNGKRGYTTTRIIHLPKGAVKASNTIEVSVADDGEVGVGAVVIRTLSAKR
ncbi:MAG: hypothetical protein SNG35_03685 [Rikenellaceae bacterium]